MRFEVVCIGEDGVRHRFTVPGWFRLDDLVIRMNEECGGYAVSFGVRELERRKCPRRRAARRGGWRKQAERRVGELWATASSR